MENEEMVVKCEIELDRIFFPKGKTTVPSGEYAIFSAMITKSIENCGNLHGRIKLKGKVSQSNHEVILMQLRKDCCRYVQPYSRYDSIFYRSGTGFFHDS